MLAEIEAHKKGIATRDLELDDLRREVQQLKARLSEIEDSHEMSKHAAGKTREAQAEADILEEVSTNLTVIVRLTRTEHQHPS